MAYASKYYDPVKAHEYYMRTRELKGYENRYGGSRGDGTSAASGGSISTTSVKKSPAQATKEHNQNLKKQMQSVKSQASAEIGQINSEIQALKNQLNSMSKEDRAAARDNINSQIRVMRQNIQAIRDNQADNIQALREQQKGGSTAGFNQKGREAAEYIKNQMENERKELTKKTNKEIDSKMLSDVKRLQADIEAMRKSGRGFSRQQFLSRITAMTKKAKQTKNKTLAKHKAEYKQKYKDEIDKLRQDKSMYTYYDNRAKKMAKRAEAEAKRQQREAEREARRAEREANRKRR